MRGATHLVWTSRNLYYHVSYFWYASRAGDNMLLLLLSWGERGHLSSERGLVVMCYLQFAFIG